MSHDITAVHICDFTDVHDVRVGRWRFDFSERFGPLLLNRRTGMPLKHQPDSDDHPFWPAFEKWYAAEYKSRSIVRAGALPQPGEKKP